MTSCFGKRPQIESHDHIASVLKTVFWTTQVSRVSLGLTLALPLANSGKKLISRTFGTVSHGPDYLRFYIILFIVVPHQAIVLASHWLTFKAALFQKRKIYVFLSFFSKAPFGMVKVRFSLNFRGKKRTNSRN